MPNQHMSRTRYTYFESRGLVAYEMILRGKRNHEVAAAFGVSATRAYQLVARGKTLASRPDFEGRWFFAVHLGVRS